MSSLSKSKNASPSLMAHWDPSPFLFWQHRPTWQDTSQCRWGQGYHTIFPCSNGSGGKPSTKWDTPQAGHLITILEVCLRRCSFSNHWRSWNAGCRPTVPEKIRLILITSCGWISLQETASTETYSKWTIVKLKTVKHLSQQAVNDAFAIL